MGKYQQAQKQEQFAEKVLRDNYLNGELYTTSEWHKHRVEPKPNAVPTTYYHCSMCTTCEGYTIEQMQPSRRLGFYRWTPTRIGMWVLEHHLLNN